MDRFIVQKQNVKWVASRNFYILISDEQEDTSNNNPCSCMAEVGQLSRRDHIVNILSFVGHEIYVRITPENDGY